MQTGVRYRVLWVGLAILAFLSGGQSFAGPPPQTSPNLQLLADGGQVWAIVTQPNGGVVFGGAFSSVAGVPRNNIARLRPNGTLDPEWNPSADGGIYALAVGNKGDVYAGGTFTRIGGAARSRIAKLAGGGSGSADQQWDASSNGDVWVLAVDVDGVVYAGGAFTGMGGETRHHIARLAGDGGGAVDPLWNPTANGAVAALALDASGRIYAGGQFTEIGGSAHQRIARLSRDGIVDTTWNPSANDEVSALALGIDGSVYAGGWFTTIGGHARNYVARLSGSGNGDADPAWNPSANGNVISLVADASGQVYAAGSFTQLGGQPRRFVARLSASGAGTVDAGWNPSVNNIVRSLALDSGDAVHIGGQFTHIGGQRRMALARLLADGSVSGSLPQVGVTGHVWGMARQPDGGWIANGLFVMANGLERSNVLRLLPGGSLDSLWNPAPNGRVQTVVVDSTGAVYLGGWFTEIGGLPRSHIAKIAGGDSGAADVNWNPSADNAVFAMALDAAGAVYAAGQFTSIGGQPRGRIARIASHGAGVVDAVWNPSANSRVDTLVIDADGSVFVGGHFTSVGGVPRARIAKVSGTGVGAVDALWNPSAGNYVSGLTLAAGNTIYARGPFNSIGGQPQSLIARLSSVGAGTVDATWNPRPDSTVDALLVDGLGSVYVGGRFSSIGGQPRDRLARLAVDGDGAADPDWNPGANGWVYALVADAADGSISAGGAFTETGGQPRIGLARFLANADAIFVAGDFEL